MAAYDPNGNDAVIVQQQPQPGSSRPGSIGGESSNSNHGSLIGKKAKKLKHKIKDKLHRDGSNDDDSSGDDEDNDVDDDYLAKHGSRFYDEGVTPGATAAYRTPAQAFAAENSRSSNGSGNKGGYMQGANGDVNVVAGTHIVEGGNGKVVPLATVAEGATSSSSAAAVVAPPRPSPGQPAPATPATPGTPSRAASVRSASGSTSLPPTQSDWKRRAEFHNLFEGKVDDEEHLVSDYTCAWAKDILRHGRIYVGARHLAFMCSIIGLKCSLVIPYSDITHIEKSVTARVIPNAISVTTQQGETYLFCSFLYRDSSYDLIVDCWKSINSSAYESYMSSQATDIQAAVEQGTEESPFPQETSDPVSEKQAHAATEGSGKKLKEVALDVRFPSEPEKIFNLLYRDEEFMRQLCDGQELTEYSVTKPWTADPSSGYEAREYKYTKPLSGSVGPSSAICYITDEIQAKDPENAFEVYSVTKTPDVPSGGSFEVQTRTCLSWAGGSKGGVRMLVTTECVWSGRSMIKGIVTSASIAGQRAYNKELAKAVRKHIHAHPTEFGGGDVTAPEADDEIGTEGNAEDVEGLVKEGGGTGAGGFGGPIGQFIAGFGKAIKQNDAAIALLVLSNLVLLAVLFIVMITGGLRGGGDGGGGGRVKVEKLVLEAEKEANALQRLQVMEAAWGEFGKCVEALSSARKTA